MNKQVIAAVLCGFVVLSSGFLVGRWTRGDGRVEAGRVGKDDLTVEPRASSVSRASDALMDERGKPAVEDGSDSRIVAAETAETELSRRLESFTREEWKDIDAILALKLTSSVKEQRRSIDGAVLSKARERLRGKLPTVQPDGLGELTHPAITSRLLDELLSGADAPFSDSQWEKTLEFVEEYELAFSELESSFDDDTTRFEKQFFEVELKQKFLDTIEGLLSDRQRDQLSGFAPEAEVFPNIVSPLLMIDVAAKSMHVSQLDSVRREFEREFADDFKVTRDVSRDLTDRYWEDVSPLFGPKRQQLSQVDRVLLAGRAQLELFRGLLDRNDVGPKGIAKARRVTSWLLPEKSD